MSRQTVSNVSARAAVVTAAIQAATTRKDRRLLAGKRPVAVVVSVPSAAWVSPVEAYFTEADPPKWKTFARDGSNRLRDKPAVGNSEVSHALSRGRSVVGIAENPDQILPSTLVAAAEVMITIQPPTGAVVLDAIFRCLEGTQSDKIDDKTVAGLEFDDFVSALRTGSTAAQAIKRLKAASARRVVFQPTEKAPVLETAVEYGEARVWGLSLARDIAEYRAGRLPWSECDRGAVFVSEPGCGKSLLAASIAAACKAPLIRASMPSFFNEGGGHLGSVIQSINATFASAAAAGPVAIILLDELDAVPNRAKFSDNGSGREWWTPVIAHLLCLLDSALGDGDGETRASGKVNQRRPGIVVLGATNRIDDVDKAFLRPGRLERTIEITRPDFAGTSNILRYHLAQELRNDDLTEVIQILEGSTAAEIMDAVRGARRLARHSRRPFTLADLRRQAVGSEEEAPAYLRRLAIHEACHAVIAVALKIGTLQRVSLRAQGTSGGQAWVRYDGGDLPTLQDFEDRATMVLAAGVGERVILGTTSTGSGSDMAVASTMLAAAHASTGVTGNLFHLCNDEDALRTARTDPALRRTVTAHLRRLEKRAENLVRDNLDAIRTVADALAKARHLSGEAVSAIVDRVNAVRRPAPQRRKQPCAHKH